MKKSIFILCLLFSCSSSTLFSTTLSSPLDSLIQKINAANQQIESISYKALHRFKKMGVDEYKDRDFTVFAKRNPANIHYNFDWRINEHKGKSLIGLMYVQTDFYFINETSKKVSYEMNNEKLKQGSYHNTMQELMLFDELLYGIESLHQMKKIKLESNSENTPFLKITITNSETSERILFVNPETYLIEKTVGIEKSLSLGFEQVMEVSLTDISINQPIPDTIFDPQIYFSEDYSLRQMRKREEKEVKLDFTFSDAKLKRLLNKPMESVIDSNILIKNIDAKLMLIDFWYMSCAPCQQALPKLRDLHNKYHSQGLKIIGVNPYDAKDKVAVCKKLKERDSL